MGNPLLHIGATILCGHAAQASIAPSQGRVRVGGQVVAVQSDMTTIAGCPFMAGQKPQPCVTARWLTAATRVRVGGVPALLQTSTGICQSAEQVPQGAPNIVVTQVRVRGI
jgi:uncharacterized Zn-binding protein involved in type VI secretion